MDFDFWTLMEAAGFLIAFFLIRERMKKIEPPRLLVSRLGDTALTQGSKKALAKLPPFLLLSALILFAAAYSNPSLYFKKDMLSRQANREVPAAEEGIAIYFVLDRSGSMAQKVSARTSAGRYESIAKLQLMKQVTRQFVLGSPSLGLKGRPGDLLGLVAFARGAEVLVPLTLDHEAFLQKLGGLTTVTQKSEDGTAVGYALFKTVNLIAATRHYAQDLIQEGKPAYEMKNAVIILVTDGFQDPNPLDSGKQLRNMDLLDAGEYARDNQVKIYIVNVEPQIAAEKYVSQRNLLRQTAEMSGGKFYLVNDANHLEQIYGEIDRLEKSILPQELLAKLPKRELPDLYETVPLYPYLIAAGILFLFLGVSLNTMWLRRMP